MLSIDFPGWAVVRARGRSSGGRHRRAPGFTLIEVLVVVAIIALLISILLPSLRLARDVSKRSVCASNIHQHLMGMGSYAADFKGYLPWRGWFSYSISEVPREAYGTGGRTTKTLVNLGMLMGKHLGQTGKPTKNKKPGKEWDILYCPSTIEARQTAAGGLPSLWDPAYNWSFGGYNYALPMGKRVGGPRLDQEVYPHDEDKLDAKWVNVLKSKSTGPEYLELMPRNAILPLVTDFVVGGPDDGAHGTGINVGYSDGHVSYINYKTVPGGTSGSVSSFELWYYAMLRP